MILDNLAFGVVALIALLIGLFMMDVLWAHRSGMRPFGSRKRRGLNFAMNAYMDVPKTLNVPDWGVMATGDSGSEEIEQAWLRAAQELYGIFVSKQSDYGPTNIAVGGEQGITIRLGDKISRQFELLGLTDRDVGEPSNESIRDTWVDIGDYGIIGMIVNSGDWASVDPRHVWGREALVDLVEDMASKDETLYPSLSARLLSLGIAQDIADDIDGAVVQVNRGES